MNIHIEPGRYVVAVSGGVDSMVLLHVLQSVPGVQLTVAHYDHGIRDDSYEDRVLVQKIAYTYGLPFEYEEGKLGQSASEDTARKARYYFLHTVRDTVGAEAIITAHHKDDALETAVINIIRGTGRKGLASMKSTDMVKRPLLHIPKSQIMEYARQNGLVWREDSTNIDQAYLRNHIRHSLLTRLGPSEKEKLDQRVAVAGQLNTEIDDLLEKFVSRHSDGVTLERRPVILLPHAVAREVLAHWLRKQGIRTFDKKMLERLVRGVKINSAGTHIPIDKTAILKIGKVFLALEPSER